MATNQNAVVVAAVAAVTRAFKSARTTATPSTTAARRIS